MSKSVVAAAAAILRDAGFRERLRALQQINARKDTATTGREAAAFVLGDAAPPSQVPTQYLLNPCTIDRARSGAKTAAYACAINTAAHEMTHTVLGAGNEQLYQDDAHKHQTTPLVSYTVGAIAQCLYLQRQGLLVDSMFTSCVNQVGTTSFNPNTCNETWLLSLQGLRPDARGR